MQLKQIHLKNLIKLAFIFVGFLAVQAQEKIDGLAVVVGKNIVLESDIDKFKEELKLQSDGKSVISDCQMLEQLMKQKLIAHHAIIDSVLVTQQEIDSRVDRALQYFTQQYGSEKKVIEAYGFTDLFDLKKELGRVQKENALIEKEQLKINQKTDITPEEVRLYYKGLEDKAELPEFPAEVELAQITLYAEPAKEEVTRVKDKLLELKKEIEAGASFKMKAIINSDDPSVTQNSGFMGVIKKDSPFIKEFKEVAFSLEEGEVSDPFKTLFGFHILKVHKIRGEGREVSHILMQPEISDKKLEETKKELSNIKAKIEAGELSFKDAVKKYSEEKGTKNNGGVIINPYTGETSFNLTRMDPALYVRINDLKTSQLTDVFYDEEKGGEKMYKIIIVNNRMDSHKADLVTDYVKIQKLAIAKKKQEVLEDWAEKKIADTYIKLVSKNKSCDFKLNWKKSN